MQPVQLLITGMAPSWVFKENRRPELQPQVRFFHKHPPPQVKPTAIALHASTPISLHSPSSTFIYLYQPSFTLLHLYLPPIHVQQPSFTFVPLHLLHQSSFTCIRFILHPPPLAFIYLHSPSTTPNSLHSSSFTVIYFQQPSFIFIQPSSTSNSL